MGVPRLDRALRSAADALTLISQATIRPFEGGSSVKKVREMNLHELPWPQKQLESLGSTQVRLRVTLSYFIEPNPSNRGWNGRYAYPSYGLRFSSKRQNESLGKFRERINKRSRTPNTVLTSHSVDKNWLLGADQQQKPGSLHTDIWIGPAIDLANKNAIACTLSADGGRVVPPGIKVIRESTTLSSSRSKPPISRPIFGRRSLSKSERPPKSSFEPNGIFGNYGIIRI